MDKEVPDFTPSQLTTLQHLNSAVHEETCHYRDLPMIMVKNPESHEAQMSCCVVPGLSRCLPVPTIMVPIMAML